MLVTASTSPLLPVLLVPVVAGTFILGLFAVGLPTVVTTDALLPTVLLLTVLLCFASPWLAVMVKASPLAALTPGLRDREIREEVVHRHEQLVSLDVLADNNDYHRQHESDGDRSEPAKIHCRTLVETRVMSVRRVPLSCTMLCRSWFTAPGILGLVGGLLHVLLVRHSTVATIVLGPIRIVTVGMMPLLCVSNWGEPN